MRGLRAHGDTGVLVEVDDVAQALALHAALRLAPPPGLVDLVPAARSVLVRVAPGTDLRAVAAAVRAVRLAAPEDGAGADEGDAVEIPVVYDGEDLGDVARLTGLHDTRGRRRAHRADVDGGVRRLRARLRLPRRRRRPPPVPRLSVPRTSVPAGAVALAGEFGGVYPRASPGGWQLIGRTDHEMWCPDRDPPAVLTPGVRVRFVERAA